MIRFAHRLTIGLLTTDNWQLITDNKEWRFLAMKTRGGRFLMVLGVTLAIMAFVVVYVVMQKGLVNGAGAGGAQAVPTSPPSVSIAIVARDVPAYTILAA